MRTRRTNATTTTPETPENPVVPGAFEVLKRLAENKFITIEDGVAFLWLTKDHSEFRCESCGLEIDGLGHGHKEGCPSEGVVIEQPTVVKLTEKTRVKGLTGLTTHQAQRITDIVDPTAEARKTIKKLKAAGLTSEQIAQLAQV